MLQHSSRVADARMVCSTTDCSRAQPLRSRCTRAAAAVAGGPCISRLASCGQCITRNLCRTGVVNETECSAPLDTARCCSCGAVSCNDVRWGQRCRLMRSRGQSGGNAKERSRIEPQPFAVRMRSELPLGMWERQLRPRRAQPLTSKCSRLCLHLEGCSHKPLRPFSVIDEPFRTNLTTPGCSAGDFLPGASTAPTTFSSRLTVLAFELELAPGKDEADTAVPLKPAASLTAASVGDAGSSGTGAAPSRPLAEVRASASMRACNAGEKLTLECTKGLRLLRLYHEMPASSSFCLDFRWPDSLGA
jgi:hypothetical protein